jgi:predicted transcriptional regulator
MGPAIILLPYLSVKGLPLKALVLTASHFTFRRGKMQVRFKVETELRLQELALSSGRSTDDLIEDALAGYLEEVAELRSTLDSRYDDIKSGRVKPIDGKAFFETLRRRERIRGV